MTKLFVRLVGVFCIVGCGLMHGMGTKSSSTYGGRTNTHMSEQEQLNLAVALSMQEQQERRQQPQETDDMKRAQELSLQEHTSEQERLKKASDDIDMALALSLSEQDQAQVSPAHDEAADFKFARSMQIAQATDQLHQLLDKKHGTAKDVKELILRGADLTSRQCDTTSTFSSELAPKLSPLMKAVKRGDVAICRELLKHTDSVNEREVFHKSLSSNGQLFQINMSGTPLLMAALQGNEELCRLLLDAHAVIDLCLDEYPSFIQKCLSLFQQCCNLFPASITLGHINTIRLLIERGAAVKDAFKDELLSNPMREMSDTNHLLALIGLDVTRWTAPQNYISADKLYEAEARIDAIIKESLHSAHCTNECKCKTEPADYEYLDLPFEVTRKILEADPELEKEFVGFLLYKLQRGEHINPCDMKYLIDKVIEYYGAHQQKVRSDVVAANPLAQLNWNYIGSLKHDSSAQKRFVENTLIENSPEVSLLKQLNNIVPQQIREKLNQLYDQSKKADNKEDNSRDESVDANKHDDNSDDEE